MYALSVFFLVLCLLCCGYGFTAAVMCLSYDRTFVAAAWTAALSLPASAVCYHFTTGAIQ
jgi:hypothetical protein